MFWKHGRCRHQAIFLMSQLWSDCPPWLRPLRSSLPCNLGLNCAQDHEYFLNKLPVCNMKIMWIVSVWWSKWIVLAVVTRFFCISPHVKICNFTGYVIHRQYTEKRTSTKASSRRNIALPLRWRALSSQSSDFQPRWDFHTPIHPWNIARSILPRTLSCLIVRSHHRCSSLKPWLVRLANISDCTITVCISHEKRVFMELSTLKLWVGQACQESDCRDTDCCSHVKRLLIERLYLPCHLLFPFFFGQGEMLGVRWSPADVPSTSRTCPCCLCWLTFLASPCQRVRLKKKRAIIVVSEKSIRKSKYSQLSSEWPTLKLHWLHVKLSRQFVERHLT